MPLVPRILPLESLSIMRRESQYNSQERRRRPSIELGTPSDLKLLPLLLEELRTFTLSLDRRFFI